SGLRQAQPSLSPKDAGHFLDQMLLGRSLRRMFGDERGDQGVVFGRVLPGQHGVARQQGGFRSEVQPRRQHWFLNEKSGFPFRTPAFCSVSRGQRRLGEKEYRAPSVTPGVALRDRTQAGCGSSKALWAICSAKIL